MRILGFVLLLLTGCTGDLVELGTGGGGGADLAQGGTVPSNLKFFPDIQSDIDSAAMACSTCHGAAQAPVLQPSAVAGTGDANYTNFMNKVNTTTPEQSAVLTKNLPGSTHVGGSKFTQGTSDPVYQRWLGWIKAGAPKQ